MEYERAEKDKDRAEKDKDREEAARIRAHETGKLEIQLQIMQAEKEKAQTEMMNRIVGDRGTNLPDTRHVTQESSGESS